LLPPQETQNTEGITQRKKCSVNMSWRYRLINLAVICGAFIILSLSAVLGTIKVLKSNDVFNAFSGWNDHCFLFASVCLCWIMRYPQQNDTHTHKHVSIDFYSTNYFL